MRLACLTLFVLIQIVLPVHAETVSTPGAIASLSKPAGTQFQYLQVTDLSVISKGQQTQFSLTVLPHFDPRQALQAILKAVNAQQHNSLIKADKLAGFSAASVHVKQQSSDWWMVIQLTDLNLFIRVQDVSDALAHRNIVTKLVQSIRLAPVTYPALVSGSYTTNHTYNGPGYGSSIGTYGESSVTLQPNGVFGTSAYVGISGADVSGYSQGGGDRGWWQVRGNRILAFEPPETFYNYRFEAFSNGLEVYNDSNEKLLWVRK